MRAARYATRRIDSRSARARCLAQRRRCATAKIGRDSLARLQTRQLGDQSALTSRVAVVERAARRVICLERPMKAMRASLPAPLPGFGSGIVGS